MKKSVLIIEEHEHLRKLLSMFLSKNFQVLPARNGVEAMGWVRKGIVPNIIISGSASRNRATEDFFNALGYSGIFAHVPVISLSAENVSDSVCLPDLKKRIEQLVGNTQRSKTPESVLIPEGTTVVLN